MNQETKNRVKTVTSVPQMYSAINILYFLLSEGGLASKSKFVYSKKTYLSGEQTRTTTCIINGVWRRSPYTPKAMGLIYAIKKKNFNAIRSFLEPFERTELQKLKVISSNYIPQPFQPPSLTGAVQNTLKKHMYLKFFK